MDTQYGALESVTIEVGDLDRWVAIFTPHVGAGFVEQTVASRLGPARSAQHPCGLELIQAGVATGHADGEPGDDIDQDWVRQLAFLLGC